MKKIIVLAGFLAILPFAAWSEESQVKVETPSGGFEVKTGQPSERVIVEKPVVVEKTERTTVVQPKSGCGCQLDSGDACK